MNWPKNFKSFSLQVFSKRNFPNGNFEVNIFQVATSEMCNFSTSYKGQRLGLLKRRMLQKGPSAAPWTDFVRNCWEIAICVNTLGNLPLGEMPLEKYPTKNIADSCIKTECFLPGFSLPYKDVQGIHGLLFWFLFSYIKFFFQDLLLQQPPLRNVVATVANSGIWLYKFANVDLNINICCFQNVWFKSYWPIYKSIKLKHIF